MKTLNRHIAIEPLVRESAMDRPKSRGLDIADVSVTKLLSSKVMFDSDSFKSGDTVYFRSDIQRMPFVQQKLSLGEKTFILVPEDFVVLSESAKNE